MPDECAPGRMVADSRRDRPDWGYLTEDHLMTEAATFAPLIEEGPKMKRDMELIRAILTEVEGKEDIMKRPLEIAGVEPVKLARHAEYLIEAGLLDGEARSTGRSSIPDLFVRDLTWQGHEFLAAIRNKTVWSRLQQKLGEDLPVLPLEVIKAAGTKALTELMLGRLG